MRLLSIILIVALLNGCTKIARSTEAYKDASPTTQGVIAGTTTGATVGHLTGMGIVTGAAVGAAVGGVVGVYLAQHNAQVEKLQSMGVYFVRMGDHVMLVIPSGMLFKGFSASFSDDAYQVLGMTTQLLAGITKVSIQVAAFAPAYDQSDEAIQLTTEQAKKVETYFWYHGVDTRLIYSVGYGGGHPVSFENPGKTKYDINYRIEITLEDLDQAKSEMYQTA